MASVLDESEFAGASGDFLEENRRARLNLIRESLTTLEILKRAEEKATEKNGVESNKRGTDLPAG